jgi:hypothetical protein
MISGWLKTSKPKINLKHDTPLVILHVHIPSMFPKIEKVKLYL